MALFALEQSKLAYRADFALYALAVPAVAIGLLTFGPHAHRASMLGWSAAGLFGWTLVEYLLHRFVLHGLQPFQAWHEAHHTRPTALICTPTPLSASLIVALVFAPALLLTGLWQASALTLGVLIGYLAYAVTHHATHHWRADNVWLKRRKLSHATHHHSRQAVSFGVTSGVWDHVFGSAPRSPKRRD
jgi:sterol desaturase/sphingolipid hydroxylase (fatty acid hydroxylase superfamily)